MKKKTDGRRPKKRTRPQPRRRIAIYSSQTYPQEKYQFLCTCVAAAAAAVVFAHTHHFMMINWPSKCFMCVCHMCWYNDSATTLPSSPNRVSRLASRSPPEPSASPFIRVYVICNTNIANPTAPRSEGGRGGGAINGISDAAAAACTRSKRP